MNNDPNATNPSDPDSPEVQWLIRGARERHEERMEHAAEEPAIVGRSMEVIERNEIKLAEALALIQRLSAITPQSDPNEIGQLVFDADEYLFRFR
jgi:hypothetical protein